MRKFDGVLIASDFDGTLTGGQGCIIPRNIDAIKYFISQGGKFTVSTGRTKQGFHNFSKEFINAPVLLGNGAMAFDYLENKTVFTNAISEKSIDVLNKILAEKPYVGMEIYSVEHNAYVFNPNNENISHFNGLKIFSYKVINNIKKEIFPAVKIMLSVGDKTFEVQQFLQKIDLEEIKFIPCTGSFVELLAKNAGKGNALLQLADCYNISHHDVYAIGDGANDVDMLKTASQGFSPINGDPLALSVADVTVCSNDDGCVAEVIDYLDKKYS